MNKLPKLMESWEEGSTTVEIWEEVAALPHNPNCDTMFYTLRIISKDSRKFPVLTGAIRQAKEILKRKNNRELREIKTNFDKSGKKK